ncbi:hypothetical protein ACLESO_53965 [Pyxidicoccus sp. 3LG]
MQTARAGTGEPRQVEALDNIRAMLDEALMALETESPQEVTRRYELAQAAFQRFLNPQASVALGLSSLAADVEEPKPEPSAPTGGSIPSLPDAPAGVSALGELEGMPLPSPRHMWLVELAMLALLTGVAVALGLQLLNVFSPTWGGFGAGMTAFLWGFGLHQVGNATFEGLTGLLTRVEKQGSSSSS